MDEFNAYRCPHEQFLSGFFRGFDISVDASNIKNDSDNYYITIQRNDLRDDEDVVAPFFVMSSGGAVHYSFRANESYHVTWDSSPPHEWMAFVPQMLEKGDWVRYSYCLQGKSTTVLSV